jgi:HK97 family phage major capsid protein
MSELDMRKANMDLQKALNENTNTQGGFLVPEVWGTRLYELIVAKSTAIQFCEQVTMTSDTLFYPKVTAASTAFFVLEAGTITESQPTFAQISLIPKKVAAITRMSSEVMEDSNPSVMEAVMERLATDIALKVDSEIYNGTTTTGGYLGWRGSTTVSSVDVAGAFLSTDNISDAIEKLQVENIEPTDLVINPKVLNELRKLKTTTAAGNNEPLLNLTTFGSTPLGNGVVGKIWGVNVVLTTQLSTFASTTTATHVLTDGVLLARRLCGIFARRREIQMNRFYVIENDDWKVQANLRAAFSINYEKSVCILKNIRVD